MNIPKKLKVLGHWYSVELTRKKQMNGLCGSFNVGYKLIRITEEMPESITAETLLHEVIELIAAILELDMEHKQVSAMSEVLFQVLRDNDLKFGV